MNETGTKNQTPYSAWLQTDILHSLQQTVSNHPGEYAFVINAQVQELYWALIVREMQAAQACSPLRPSLSDSEPTRHHRFHSDSPIGRGRILRPPRPPARHRGNRFEVSQTPGRAAIAKAPIERLIARGRCEPFAYVWTIEIER